VKLCGLEEGHHYLLLAGHLLALLFNTEGGGSIFFENVSEHLPDHMHHFPEDHTLHSHHSKNFKPNIN
jgi:hypothetical protein